ncbi:hypothetical protein SmJEL517_g04534 [Synchytrium microbalum]|uniref:PPM-type phosphatase domain-containing protein n=1 Tax=Synchytrium microbalum TaxID=1806994 RepID=A0A507BY31_9FUNG|nr:uncharacterized protein SmJEL517_g04534 [Synchytrium microbalum]TPX32332.1 hypothetical protein SmJEL517_g04534 [Synchytrium microbalum]
MSGSEATTGLLDVSRLPVRNIVASPEPSESGSPSTTPTQKRISLAFPAAAISSSILHPAHSQDNKPDNTISHSDMSPAPVTTLLDDMDEDTVIYASTDPSSSRTDDQDSDEDESSTTNISTDDIKPASSTSTSTSSTAITTNPIPQQTNEPAGYRPPHDPRAGFSIGFAEDRNRRHRRTMEDAHAFISNFLDVPGQGYFAVFDGHAGKGAAEWCGQHFHETLQGLLQNSSTTIPEILNESFTSTDKQLAARPGMFSGCTAAVALLRVEDCDFESSSGSLQDVNMDSSTTSSGGDLPKKVNGQASVKRRVLYTANAGDARVVLCRNGIAERLSYDHKGSDLSEQKRITESGGFVLNNRVNGVLAVTRSLGDVAMKEWIIGNPYTVETPIIETDSFMIVACDGLWDVCTDQTAVDLVLNTLDPQKAAEELLAYALEHWSTDNLSVIVIRLDPNWKYDSQPAKAIVTASGPIIG